MKQVTIFFVFTFLSFTGYAQVTYNLQQCIDTALARNIPVKQADLQVQAAQVNLRQARMNVLPNLNADANHGENFGRSINRFTNTYVNQTDKQAFYSANSSIVLFNGLTLQSRIRENATAYEATRMEWQQERDKLVLNVILAYLQVLNNEDQVQLSRRQAQTSQVAFDRLQILNNQGAIKPSDLTDLKGQLMNDQLSILDASAQLESSRLLLCQLMNKPYDPLLAVERINVEEFLTAYGGTAADVYKNSLSQFAQVKAAELRTKTAAYSVRVAKGKLYPTLSLNGGINTYYSSLAKTQAGKYSNQLKNNKFSSVGLGLTIPIFNGFYARNQVRLASLDLKNSQLVEENTKLQVHQQIDQAWLNMSNAYDRYKLLLDQVNAYTESYKAAEVRFNAGVGTSVDFLIAKDRLDKANTNLVNARYEFVLRKRILDYYNGR